MLKYPVLPRSVLSYCRMIPSCHAIPCPRAPAHPQQGKKAADRREDFEKMKEISAHMDNIIQRFEKVLSFRESREETTALPKQPPLPQPEPVKDSRDRSVSARPMTVDRAVSAWRLTTDRAVSVASSLHFDDELSGKWHANHSDGGRCKQVGFRKQNRVFYQGSKHR